VTAEILLALGQPDQALVQAAEAVREAGERDWTPEVIAALEIQSLALLEMDRPEEALTVASDALQQAEAIGARPMVWRLQALRARIQRRLNDQEAARLSLVKAGEIVRALGASIPDPEDEQRFLKSPEASSVLVGAP